MKIRVKQIIKNLLSKLFSKKITAIYEEVKNYDYISFDIFDTLIKRNLKDPTDIYSVMQEKYNNEKLEDFKEKRINAECIAREQSEYEEVTLEEIYNYLDYSEKTKKELIKLEKEIEKEYCTANKEMQELYNYLIKNNKKIYLTSDMYLDENTIKTILESNEYGKFEKLYLSSDKRCTKKNGKLFKVLLKEENILNSKLVHIGDNFLRDYIAPKRLNIKSILIKGNV